MSYILSNDRDADPVKLVQAFDAYRSYLAANQARFPVGAYALASSNWYFDANDHRSPHDGWLESITVEEHGTGARGENRACTVSAWPWHLETTGLMREHRAHVGDLERGFGEGHRGVLAMVRRRCREHGDGAAGRERLCAPPLDGVAVLSRLAATDGATTPRAGCSTASASA